MDKSCTFDNRCMVLKKSFREESSSYLNKIKASRSLLKDYIFRSFIKPKVPRFFVSLKTLRWQLMKLILIKSEKRKKRNKTPTGRIEYWSDSSLLLTRLQSPAKILFYVTQACLSAKTSITFPASPTPPLFFSLAFFYFAPFSVYIFAFPFYFRKSVY